MLDQQVSFKSDGLNLAGTLTHPDSGGPFPGVLLIAGSGPIDRDANHMQLSTNVSRYFADHLAENGVATLRYDKRGVGASQGKYLSTGLYENLADAQQALRFFRGHPLIKSDIVFLLGHSEGALIATMLAAKGVTIAGSILVSGSARNGEDVLKWQVQQVAKGMRGPQKWIMKIFRIDVVKAQNKRLERLKLSSGDSYTVQLVAKVNAKWLREFLVYNPAKDLPKIRVPMLAITGGKDIQVNPDDLEVMAQLVHSEFEHKVVPGVNHILRSDPEDPPSMASYKVLVKEPLDPRILNLASEWLRRRGNEISIGESSQKH